MSDRHTLTDTKQNLLQQSQTTGKNDTTTFLQQPFCALKNMQNFIKISKLTVYKMQVISFWSTSFAFTAQNIIFLNLTHTSQTLLETTHSVP